MPDLEDNVQNIRIEGGDEVVHTLNDIANAGAEAFAKLAESALHGDFTGLIEKFAGEIPAAIYKTVEAVGEFILEQAHAVETMGNLAQAVGANISQFYGLREAFASVGIGARGFELTVNRMALSIENSWQVIQEQVRNGASAHAAAELAISDALLNVRKAYDALDETIHKSHATAIADAHSVASAEIAAAQARNALASSPEHIAEGLRATALAYTRAKLEYDKTLGYNVDADEKILQEHEKLLAVQQAQTAYTDAFNAADLKAKEAKLAVEKADQALVEARHKQEEDSIKAQIDLETAHLGVSKARLAVTEAIQRAHELELKDVESIAQKINTVAAGQAEWNKQVVLTEASASTLRTSLIRAASLDNGGAEPDALMVFRKMSEVFTSVGGKAMDMNEKLAIVQRTMGAGFRAGQASASQLLAVLEKGPEALAKFMAEGKKFGESGIGIGDKEKQELEDFEAAWAQLAALVDQMAGHFAAFMASGLTEWLKSIKEALLDDTSTLRQFIDGISSFVTLVAHGVETIYEITKAIITFTVEMVKAWAVDHPTQFMVLMGVIAAVITAIIVSFAPFTAAVLGVVAAVGYLRDHWVEVKTAAQDFFDSVGKWIDDKIQSIKKFTNAIASIFGAGSGAKQGASGAGAEQGLSGLAGGGEVHGPGGPKDDTAGVFALSDGEFVVSAAAVSHYGSQLFHALNNLSVGGKADGGFIGTPRVAVAGATLGAEASSSILNLTIDGETFGGLRAPENVAAKLRQFAIGRQSAATGDLPSWMR